MQSPAPHPQPLPPLAIVGASTRSAAASASRAGYQPLTADLFADADLRRFATATRISPYPEGFIDWMRTVEPPAWMFTGALENHPELVDQLAWIAPLWGNPGDVLTRIRDPRELEHVLCSGGLLFPETHYSSEGLSLDGAWLEKTYRGASGSGVRELMPTRRQGDKETGSEDAVAADSLCLPLSLSPCLCYQRRIPGTPCAAVFVAAEGAATLLGVTRQLIGHDWLGAHGFQYAGSIGPWPTTTEVQATLVKIGSVLAEHFELTGLFGVDFILDADNQVWTIEVNPRYTASVEVVERITGIHAIATHVTACRGLPIDEMPKSEITLAHGKATLFARRDVTITHQFAEYALAEALHTPWPTLADISTAGSLVEAGRPVLTLFAVGHSVDEVEQQLRLRVQELEHRIYTGAS